MRVLRVLPIFERDFRVLTGDMQEAMLARVTLLQEDVQHPQLNLKKMVNVRPVTWRMRIGSYRVLFRYDHEAIYLIRVLQRKDVYRGL